MRKTILPITLLLGIVLAPAAAGAQIAARAGASIQLNLPVVLPQLVVVAPGVQVVPDVDEEVFFVDGFYYARHGDGWYRSKHHRRGWVLVPGHRVPARIVKFEPGRYRRWKPEHHDRGVRDHGRGDGRWGDDRRGRDDSRGRDDGWGRDDSRGRDDGRGKHKGEKHGRNGRH